MIDCSLYMVVTGGGSEVISWLLKYGGASSYFVGAEVPYYQDITKTILEDDMKIVSDTAAYTMSVYALKKASVKPNDLVIGLAATSSLAKENQREDRKNETYLNLYIRNKKESKERVYYLHKEYDNTKGRIYQEEQCCQFIYDVLSSIRENGTLKPNFSDVESITIL